MSIGSSRIPCRFAPSTIMACCVITAYVMSRIIRTCELFNLQIIKTQYNAFDDGPYHPHNDESRNTRAVAKLSVEGMTCSACTSTIEAALNSLPGVAGTAISLPLATVSVVYDTTISAETDLTAAIEAQGYRVGVGGLSALDRLEKIRLTSELAQLHTAFNNSALLASFAALIAYLQPYTTFNKRLQHVLALVVFCICLRIQLIDARWIHARAWSKRFLASPTMDTLISTSLLLGVALNLIKFFIFQDYSAATEASSGSFLVVVVTGGRYLDNLMRRQTNDGLAQLYALQSETTLVDTYRTPTTNDHRLPNSPVTPKMKQSIPAVCLEPGDEIVIYAGSVVPCDCYVSSGTSIIGQAAMTGETLPVTRSEADFLMSGTRNLSSDLRAIVSKSQEDSALSQLVSSAAKATEQRASTETADVLSGCFVHLIFFIAACAAAYEYLIRSALQPNSLRITQTAEKTMAILSSACPCALGLATPSAIMSGLSAAWERGIIFRNGSSTFETMAKLTHMAMDKTGTLTTGQLTVSCASNPVSTELNTLICVAERQDALVHPVGRAVFQWAFKQLSVDDKVGQAAIICSNLHTEVGRGIRCSAHLPGRSRPSIVHVGSTAFFHSHDIVIPDEPELGKSLDGVKVHIALNHRHATTLFLHDTVRPEALAVLIQLRKSLSLTMLTGDTAVEASRISEALSIPILSAHALPHEKANFVNSLREKKSRLLDATCASPIIAMLGDGLNDTPAFRAADLGVLLSPGLSRSTSAQASVADVIVTSSNLGRLVEAIAIAKATVTQMKWNMRWALAYNVLAVGAAAGVFEPWGVKVNAARAGMLMTGSSVSVLGWSMWFRRQLRRKMRNGNCVG